jgi:hypothetical protein
MLAVGYLNGKKYGHIQVWTGYKWVEFPPKTITYIKRRLECSTLRMNEKGIAACKITVGSSCISYSKVSKSLCLHKV